MPETTNDTEKYTKQLKRRMEYWREAVLPINSILLWERSWYPGMIIGITSAIFLAIWLLEPALLTIISITLLVLGLIDYLVPVISVTFVSANSWTGQKERKLTEICQNLSSGIVWVQNTWNWVLHNRNNRPGIYYGWTTLSLLLLAWVGSIVNNLFLIYITLNIILLAPGLKHKDRARTLILSIRDRFFHSKTV